MVEPSEFAERILAWFDRHGRKDLPWQLNATPYRVWVSEIMLQQTRVSSVIAYFGRFMSRFPDVVALADAPMDQVLHLWSGLGYYARARNLHRAAGLIRDHYGGRIPQDLETLCGLPGIGRSTAGAILALCYGKRVPILDGNVKRVLARVFLVEGWPGQTPVARRLWELAEWLTPENRIGDYTQAMMDLGATLCTRRRPGCTQCPMQDLCQAHIQGRVMELPGPKPQAKLPVRGTRLLMLCNKAGEVLLEQRPPAGIWGGLWSLPECDLDVDVGSWCRERLGCQVGGIREWPKLRHSFSHFHLDIIPVRIEVLANPAQVMEAGQRVWYNTAQPDVRGLAAPVSRLLAQLHQQLAGEIEQ